MPASKGLAAVCIAANALTAGSIFCWPVFGPQIRQDLGLTLTETNTIWSGAVVGQYATSAVMGSISDNYGPRPLSLLASLLFAVGYFLMAKTERSAVLASVASHSTPQAHNAAFVAMTAFFVLVGAGVAASLFSALCASSAHFKSHPGLALSIPLTLFSLSSLFLSSIASLSFFTNPDTGDLNSPRWLACMGATLMAVNGLSAYGLSVPDTEDAEVTTANTDESSPLLPTPPTESANPPRLAYTMPRDLSASDSSPTAPVLSLREFVQTPSAWVFALVLFAAVGGAEMVMSSIGSMVFSLQSANTMLQQPGRGQSDDEIGRETLAIRTRQVQLIAIANTASRLFVGFASDLLSPSRKRREEAEGGKKWKMRLLNMRLSRITLLLSSLALLFVTFLLAALALNHVNQLWMVSIATGLGYGLIFTIVPTLIMRAWPKQFGRNFGILNYAAALGSLCFSMLFALVNDSVARNGWSVVEAEGATATCHQGRHCFALSFLLASLTLFTAFLFTLPLWKAWRYAV